MTVVLTSGARVAYAIVVESVGMERFWVGFNNRGKAIRTAWSLAGATLLPFNKLDAVVRKLTDQGRTFRVVDVVMVEP